jgi:hypothetical protein
VRIQHRHDGQPPRVRHAEHADPPVVPRHVPQQPLDRIVAVGALVDRLGVPPVARRPQHHEVAFGAEPTADVLEDEDEAFLRQPPGEVVKVLAAPAIP